jgi:hypothetical protein
MVPATVVAVVILAVHWQRREETKRDKQQKEYLLPKDASWQDPPVLAGRRRH